MVATQVRDLPEGRIEGEKETWKKENKGPLYDE